MTSIVLALSLLASHPDTVIKVATKDVKYLLPCTWKCSCDWNKTYAGWLVLINGKVYHVEGDRVDGGPTPDFIYNPNRK